MTPKVQISGKSHRRSHAVGFWIWSREFLDAREALGPAPVRPFTPVRYYLTCHAIELAMKAFFLAEGEDIAFLKDMNHDLMRALSACEAHGLAAVVHVGPEAREQLRIANAYYKGKGFEYYQAVEEAPGYAGGLPDLSVLDRLARELVETLKPICSSSSANAR